MNDMNRAEKFCELYKPTTKVGIELKNTIARMAEEEANLQLSLLHPVSKLTIEVVKIPDDEGGGVCVCVPELGRMAVLGDGESLKEALSDLFNEHGEEIEEAVNK